MNKKILSIYSIFLYRFLFIASFIFIMFMILLFIWIKDNHINQIKTNLLENINIISLQIKNLQNVNQLTKDIKNNTGLKITIIAKNGNILGDSDNNFTKMDNQFNSLEDISIQHQELESSLKYLYLTKEGMIYVIKKFNINSYDYYIKISREVDFLNKYFFDLYFKAVILFLIFIVLLFWLSLKLREGIKSETEKIVNFIKNLLKYKKHTVIESLHSIEFNKINKYLSQASINLIKRNKKKSKYTAKLKLSNKQKDDIISAISHEFKNPIAIISGYTQTLQEDKSINQKIQDKFLAKINSSADKITAMIDRLRFSIKLEDSEQNLNLQECDIKKLTEEVIQDLTITYPKSNIKLIGNETLISIDKIIFQIAITNLIENAVKYSDDKIIIKISIKSISVRDSGIGIKKSDLSNITNKFYRASSNKWNNSLGIGLSLVKNIVKLHNFKLKINSIENKGSVFKIIYA